MKKGFVTIIMAMAMNFGLHAAPGPNEVCVNNDWTYTLVNSAFQFLTAGDVIYFHEQTYDWTYASITESCEIDGIADQSIAELNMTTLNINGSGAITVTIKDMIFRGGGKIAIGSNDHVIFENCTFENTAYNQIDASGAAATWSNVEFTDCVFNRTGSPGQNLRFSGDVSMDNCFVNGLVVYEYNNDVTIVNSHFLDSELNGSSDGFSPGRHNVNYLSNVHFENTDVQLKNNAERTYAEDLILEPFLTEFDYRIYGDTCEIYRVECPFASSFSVSDEDITKYGIITIEDVHFELLTDSYIRITAPDSSDVQLRNVVVDSCRTSSYGFYLSTGNNSDVLLEDCFVNGSQTGFFTNRSPVQLINCHAINCLNYGFWMKRGTMDRCSALDCGHGVYANSASGDFLITNSIFADGTGNGIHLSHPNSGDDVNFECYNNTLVNNDGYGAYFDQTSGTSMRPTVYYMNNLATENTDGDLNISSNIRTSGQYEIRNNLFADHWTDYSGFNHRDCIWSVIGSYHDVHFDEDAESRLDQFRLLPNSPAINNGLDVTNGYFDFGATTRIIQGNVDIGAFEFNDTLPYLVLSSMEPFWEGAEDGQVINVEIVNGKFDSTLDVNNWSLVGYENGFVSLTAVEFISDHYAEVTLSGNTPYLVWPLFRNQYYFGLQAGMSEFQGLSDSVQGTGVLYLKAGEPIPDVREIYRFHDQENMMYSTEGTGINAKDILVTTDVVDNTVEFNIEVPATGVYEFEWKGNKPTSTGLDRIYEDDNLVLVQNESIMSVGSWDTQTMNLSLTEGFHRMRFHFPASGIEIEWFEFKDLITGNEELEASSVNVYPVPMKDELIIDSEYEVSSYELRGMNGNVLRSGTSSIINTESLVSGAYILKVETPEGFIIKKLIK